MAQFGDLLAELRQDRGLTQSELGKVISVTSGTISNYEHGFHLPDLEKLVLLLFTPRSNLEMKEKRDEKK